MEVNGNTLLVKESLKKTNHHAVAKNPLRDDAFDKQDALKIKLITEKFKDIIEILGFDLTHDSIKDTPNRVAKMYVNEVFKGLNPKNKPKITVFKNEYGYHTPLVELNIPFTSFCEHHFVPIQGKANIAYVPKDYVIGLSKIHRIVDFYARRPQVQERLTMQILQELSLILETKDVGVVLKANHSCISCRGVQDLGSTTLTSVFLGEIENNSDLISVLLDSNCQ
ncbi:GTP cyclohydrolase I FolE [Marixanthomonas spongiae]|uniref:GTP cyclohydrolase 1 n=1 Tax=Marixanthomonas spongiae TaxID=2174845 RepID=A0A2U0HU64_9FLAO|nr:GTP cyclohydrolase I FolE [Marixanthomonas spongiae]PVW12412.1 GTP cyclohydrolase I FolE [Marixanthomonas spongiae]